MTPSTAGRTGGLTRAVVHGAAQRREWAAKGGRIAMGIEASDSVPVVVLVSGRLIPVAELDDVQRHALASLRARELAQKRWSRRDEP